MCSKPRCGNNNFARRTECHKCGTPKGEEADGETRGKDSGRGEIRGRGGRDEPRGRGRVEEKKRDPPKENKPIAPPRGIPNKANANLAPLGARRGRGALGADAKGRGGLGGGNPLPSSVFAARDAEEGGGQAKKQKMEE